MRSFRKFTVKAYLDKRADEDELFAARYARAGKNMDDCTVYILNTVRQSGCNGFTDSEIYSMALHYWDEENIETGNPVDCQVVVNHTVELTAGEREKARREAMKRRRRKRI
jgi:hypothetical protein